MLLGDPPSALMDDPLSGIPGSGRGRVASPVVAAAGSPLQPAVGAAEDDGRADDGFDADDDDELDLRFLPGDFKSTNV